MSFILLLPSALAWLPHPVPPLPATRLPSVLILPGFRPPCSPPQKTVFNLRVSSGNNRSGWPLSGLGFFSILPDRKFFGFKLYYNIERRVNKNKQG